jgi:hypothetical protein
MTAVSTLKTKRKPTDWKTTFQNISAGKTGATATFGKVLNSTPRTRGLFGATSTARRGSMILSRTRRTGTDARGVCKRLGGATHWRSSPSCRRAPRRVDCDGCQEA